MAEIYLLNKTNKISLLALDVLLTESYTRDSEVTEYAVEDGSVITDQIFNKPIQVVLTGGVSAFHLDSSISWTPENAFQYLEDLQTKRELISITTGLKTYFNMAITNISINRDKTNSGHVLKFSLTAKQVNIVKTEYVNPANISPKIKSKVTPRVTVPPLFTRQVEIEVRSADNTRVTLPDGSTIKGRSMLYLQEINNPKSSGK
jgi:hypothetical protein